MKSHTVFIRNTLLTYGKLIFSAGFSLVGSRWALSSLGHTDFVLFSLQFAIGCLMSLETGNGK